MNFDHINDYSYVRLYLPRLIEADRILYLDSDIIVNGNLTPFLDLALEDGATLDIKHMKAYNSEVILIDCAQWQQYHLEEACYQIIRQESQITNGDQNVINLACRDYVQELLTYYNYQVGYDMTASCGRMKSLFEELLDDQALIIHFLTPDKFWNHLADSENYGGPIAT